MRDGVHASFKEVSGEKNHISKKELLRGEKEEVLGRKYDQLLEEREDLQKRLSEFDFDDFRVVFRVEFFDKERLEKIIEKWLEKVRAETSLLSSIDRLGIEIFKEDLEDQPNFPNKKIIFGSSVIKERSIVNLENISGQMTIGRKEVDIKATKPSLNEQAAYFLKKGRIDPDSAILLHELVHVAHEEKNMGTDEVLTEVQAYFCEILEKGNNFSLTDIIEELTKKKEEGGLYEYDIDKVIKAITNIVGLYALGKEDDRIATCIAKSYFDKEKNKFIPLTDKFEGLLDFYNVSEIDIQALDDIFRLHQGNQRMKAQLEFYETLANNIPTEELEKITLESVSKRIIYPEYYLEGKKINGYEVFQNVYYPASEEFPYNYRGKRSGIIFGFFKDKEGIEKFNIGRLETEEKNSKLDLSSNEGEVEYYLEVLSRESANIDIKYKEFILEDYYEKDDYSNPLIRKVLQSILTKEEVLNIAKNNIEDEKDTYKIIDREITLIEGRFNRKGNLRPQDEKKIKAYKEMIEKYSRNVLDHFDLDYKDIDPDLAQKTDNLLQRLNILESHLDKKEAA